jgi:hypothetical protein
MSRDPDDQDEESVGESLRSFLFEQVNKFFVDHIPVDSIKELDTACECLCCVPW